MFSPVISVKQQIYTGNMNIKCIAVLIVLTMFSCVCVLSTSGTTTAVTNRCDIRNNVKQQTDCVNCRRNARVKCPSGFTKLTKGRGKRGCRYRINVGSSTRPVRGCSHTCANVAILKECCPGFWGQDCQSCPYGYSGTVCSGRGICSDKVGGNGTCSCRGQIAGSSCESCQNETQYGPSCQQVCECVNGRCDSGPDRPGTCSCESGFGGAACNVVLADCATLGCHENSRCIQINNSLVCRCNSGYHGNGSWCEEVDPCEKGANLCAANSSCLKTGPAKYVCKCNDGYKGDGKWCQPIDPCQTNNGGCSVNDSLCEYVAPGQSRCLCKPGYANSTDGCLLIDICGLYPNTTCDATANCTTVEVYGTIQVECMCQEGMVLQGMKCYSDLLTELTFANSSGPFQNRLNFALSMFERTYFRELFYGGRTFTLMAPLDGDFGSELWAGLNALDNINDTSSPDFVKWKAIARAHIVATSVVIDFTRQSATTMYSLLGYNYPIKALKPIGPDPNPDDDDTGVFAAMTYGPLKRRGSILTSANWATNGVFYVTDTLMNPEPFAIANFDAWNLTLSQTLASLPSVTQSAKALRNYGNYKRDLSQFASTYHSGNNNVAIFVPTDEAFAALTPDELEFLTSEMGKEKMNFILGEHVIYYRDRPLSAFVLTDLNSIVAVTSSIIPVNVSESNGVITVGNAKVLVTEIHNGNLLIYLIDKIIIPDSALPIVENRCENSHVVEVSGPCGPCQRTDNLCNPGGNLTQPNSNEQPCAYSVTLPNSVRPVIQIGCKYSCQEKRTTTTCCPGYYGPGCESCPGPLGNSCNGNGICSDGLNGQGVCSCFPAYMSEDCSVCSNNMTYGTNCNQACTCRNGICANTVSSRGVCVSGSCHDTWAGENCDRAVVRCGTPSIPCHQHATCVSSNGTESCVCDPGYITSGLDCIEFNPCSDDELVCDVDATCAYYGQGRYNCTCRLGYEGDGKSCQPIDYCRKPDRGGCHINAQCYFKGPAKWDCKCDRGYRGDGFQCVGIQTCLEGNGGCHLHARCIQQGAGENDCQCLDGYSGNGYQCVGPLLLEVAEYPDLYFIKEMADKWQSVTDLFNSIRYEAVTAFFPRNEAWRTLSLNDYHFWDTADNFPILLKHHIAKGALAVADLNPNTQLETLLPLSPIQLNNVTININTDSKLPPINVPTLGLENAKIVQPNLMTFNGIIHVIDDVMLPPRDVVNQYPTLSQTLANSTGTEAAQFSLFLSFLNNSGIISQLEESGKPYTIFAVNNNLLDPDKVGSSKSLKYHVVLGEMIRLDYIHSGEHQTTLAGSGYRITLVKRHGEYMVNGEQILQPDIRTSHGIIQGIGKLLKPIKSMCGVPMVRLYRSLCLPCIANKPSVTCPENATLLATLTCSMPILPTSPTVNSRGCKLLCLTTFTIPRCCKGFYGRDCEPCPGGVGNPCLGLGTCRDGMTGNGTCNCEDPRHTGPACDQCAPGYYGSVCDNKCDCVNGTCLDGIQGSGACVCDRGYRGVKCGQLKSATPDSCGGRCHSTSDCVAGQCVCARGYSGSGEDCTAVNPCKDDTAHCHIFATCRYRSPGKSQCLCKTGYQGDGTFCSEVNPCLAANFSSCDANADCHHTGPDMSNCICKAGFTGDGKTCDSIDPCKTNNGGCHSIAKCTPTGPGTRDCKCFPDYFGDGVTFCTGNIYAELSGQPDMAWFLDGKLIRPILSGRGPMTVFIPQIRGELLNITEEEIPYFYMDHIVVCASLSVQDLRNMTEVYSSIGQAIPVSKYNESVLLYNNISISSSQLMSNGIVHFINGTFRNFSRDFHNNFFSKTDSFTKLLNFTGLTDILSQREYMKITMFVPSTTAFQALSSYKQRLLTTDKEYAVEFNKYHIVDNSFLLPTELVNIGTFTTMQGSSVDIRCSRKKTGQILFGAGDTKMNFLILTHVPEINILAIFYILDGVLEPPSFGGRCDVRSNVTMEGTCSLCVESAMQCPGGMLNVGRMPATCSSIGTPHGGVALNNPIEGCVPICLKLEITAKCCDDYYGKDCHACPGGADNACYHNGACNDGVNGTGKCTCNSGFTGFACELCEQGRFGYDCDVCACSPNGKCADGINGDGSCFCDQGWTGVICDKKLAHPSNCSNCTENAVCVEGGKCECIPGYLGEGSRECVLPDLCNDQPNGGCSRHASCRQNTLSVTCTCLNPYVGDGYVCEGNNPCNSDDSLSVCHEFARCIYIGADVTRCSCLPGYSGDGKRQCEPDSDLTRPVARRCAVENGGCSDDATCVDLPPSSTAQNLPNVQCTCKKAFVGDGIICNGNVLQVLSQEKYNTGKFYQKILRKRYFYKLQKAKNITLFVPADQFLVTRKLKYKMLSRLTVSDKTYMASDLQNISAILVDSRVALPVQTLADGSIYINGVKILTKDIVATNGVVHVMRGMIRGEIAPLIPVVTTTVGVPVVTNTSPRRYIPTSTTLTPETTPLPLPYQTNIYPLGNLTSPVVDGGGLVPPKVTRAPAKRASGAGAKVGIAVGIMLLLVLVVGLLYWKKRSTMFVFRPLTERSPMSPGFERIDEDNASFSVGMGNPAYDSTGFNESEPSGNTMLRSHAHTGLPEPQNTEEMDLLAEFEGLDDIS